jgi:hypothetical protein
MFDSSTDRNQKQRNQIMYYTDKIKSLICAIIVLLAATAAKAEDFKLTVFRQYPGKKCTSGYLQVNDKITCYTLERPWADNQQNISSIPAGTYSAFLRYDHADHWRIELKDVPGRTNVQIHIGNQPDETKGCILVGKKLGSDLCSVENSADAYNEIKIAFYGNKSPNSTPSKSITVQIVDAGR